VFQSQGDDGILIENLVVVETICEGGALP